MIESRKTQEPGKTPAEISVMQIDQDLKDGVSKSEMAIKYGIKPWEVDEMFKHSFLKGRRPSRKKALSFKFVDDSPIAKELPLNSGDIAVEQAEEVDPRQVTLEQAIDEAIETVEDAKQEMQEAEKAIVNMLSPTEVIGDTEYHEDLVNDMKSIQPVKEDENELEIEDDTFEL